MCITSLLLSIVDMKIKRCGEMARKIRFFKDQMSKAGVSPKLILDKDVDIDLDDVEVNPPISALSGTALCFLFALILIPFPSFFSPFSVQAWRAGS